MNIIIGLGNPGGQYAGTRHNIGFECIDKLAYDYKIKVIKLKFKALVGEGQINTSKVLLVKPQTYMNLSGESVRDVIQFYKAANTDIILIYDDASLPLGQIRIRGKGSDGGHNGIKSITHLIQTDEYKRIKIGVGQKPEGWDLGDYVLGHFQKEDMPSVIKAVTDAADAAVYMLNNTLESAMNKFN